MAYKDGLGIPAVDFAKDVRSSEPPLQHTAKKERGKEAVAILVSILVAQQSYSKCCALKSARK